MYHLRQSLLALSTPIRVAIVGVGNIGKGLALQPLLTDGMTTVALCDIDGQRVRDCATWLERPYREATNSREFDEAIHQGDIAICQDSQLIADSELVDVVIDASSAELAGAKLAIKAMQYEKHVVMMNTEADLLYGPYLASVAKSYGVVYTSADGDQHTCLMRLINETQFWGFQTVMAGNIKGFMDVRADPVSILPEAEKRDLDPAMCTLYTDGTKLSIEQALVANAIGGHVSQPGMAGPRLAHVSEVFDAFDFESLYDPNRPVVDYILGAEPKGGVFLVCYSDNPHQQFTLDWYPPDLGPGPFYLFYRHFHIGHIEAMQCVAEAYLYGTSLLQPWAGMRTQVFGVAKRDLKAGEIMAAPGNDQWYGRIDNINQSEANQGVPVGLLQGHTLMQDVAKDQVISDSALNIDPNSEAVLLYKRALTQAPQDRLT